MVDIEVQVRGKGTVAGEALRADPGAEARCGRCGEEADAVARLAGAGGAPALCAACLRACLEAITIARYRFRSGQSTPWGKVTG